MCINQSTLLLDCNRREVGSLAFDLIHEFLYRYFIVVGAIK